MKLRMFFFLVLLVSLSLVACSTQSDKNIDATTVGSITSTASSSEASRNGKSNQIADKDQAAVSPPPPISQPAKKPKPASSATRKKEQAKQQAPIVVTGHSVEEKLMRDESRARLSSGVLAYRQADIRPPSEPVNRENYAHFENNPVQRVAEKPVSTFSIDVDTGSYTNTRRMLRQGGLPVKDAVRVEEFINYFSYQYPSPESKERPFNVITEIGPSPWNNKTYLLHIGIKAYDVQKEQLPPSNLVFLVDVSGSMRSADKIGLLVNSLKLLVNKMREQDSISLVVYAGASGVVLDPTSGKYKAKISAALDSLSAGGSTNGGAGIRLAYSMAQQAFIKDGINRVILATDGDFNVGTVSFEALKNLIEEKRKTGISLTTLGFGSGNYNDHLMEQLADAGNGNYAYIDTLNEAQKVLVNEMSSTLQIVAKDVKIQMEFNPALVAEYRLIGYENRALRREDFNNDKIDAGEIGAGHTVTALYEISLTNGEGQYMDELRYGNKSDINYDRFAKELGHLRLRYKMPNSDTSTLVKTAILKTKMVHKVTETSDRYRFAASVAAFGQLLRGGQYTQSYGFEDVIDLARQSRGDDPWGYRSEFINMVNLAKSLAESRS